MSHVRSSNVDDVSSGRVEEGEGGKFASKATVGEIKYYWGEENTHEVVLDFFIIRLYWAF